MITPTKEDYIRAIGYLEKKFHRHIRSVELANHLKLAKSTVSERLLELKEQNLIRHEKYSAVEFTKKGQHLAEKLTYKHRVIEAFLHEVLNISKDKIHDEAHRLEHAFSDESIGKIMLLLGGPKLDPHGMPIINTPSS